MFRSRIIIGGLAERIEPVTNMDGDAELTSIQRIKAAEEKMAKNEIKTQQSLQRMETKLKEQFDLLMQEIKSNKPQANIPPVEVPMEPQDQDQDMHEDRDEQAWLQDEMSRRTRTEQFPPTSNVTDIHAIERNINLGNTIFTS